MEGRDETHTDEADDIFVPSVQPSSENDSVKVLAIFLLYSMAIFSLPFMAYFGTRHILKNTYHIEGFANTAWSVVSAVVVVNVIILSYACRGYEEAKRDEEREGNVPKRNKSDLNEKKND